MKEAKAILVAWKNTRVLKRMGTEYPYKSAVIQGAPSQSDFRQYLNDDEAQRVDDAVLKLRIDNQEHHAVLTSFYLHGISCTKQARAVGKQTSEITKMLLAAESFIKGYIYDFFSNAK